MIFLPLAISRSMSAWLGMSRNFKNLPCRKPSKLRNDKLKVKKREQSLLKAALDSVCQSLNCYYLGLMDCMDLEIFIFFI